MDRENMKKARRRKRSRQKRQAWFVCISLLLLIAAAVFMSGFLAGSRWREHSGRGRGAADSYADMGLEENGREDGSQGNDDGEEASRERGDGEENDRQERETEEADDGQWKLMLVNRWNPIPEEYEVNLVKVEGGQQVDERIYEPLMQMLEDARSANWDQLPRVVSGYRTQEKQQSLYDDKIAEYQRQGYSDSEARELAEQWVSVPGYSEHQLGFAVDINGATYDVYLWLQENSYKYGFIFRYPGHKTDITGVEEEVWHYRYVGMEAAAEIYEQGICLEEYLEQREGAESR